MFPWHLFGVELMPAECDTRADSFDKVRVLPRELLTSGREIRRVL
jgi:hypothetical protein